uniref:Uncharacterized protein n=1 Tax=Romanomermis culicivorax TaxID=13658 RepID=A0A915HY03_ROMCU
MVSESIVVGWIGVDSSISAGASVEISSIVSFKKIGDLHSSRCNIGGRFRGGEQFRVRRMHQRRLENC